MPVSMQVLLVLSLALVAVAGMFVLWRLRVGALVRRNAELEERVRQRTQALQLATEELHFLALHDELTALINQRGFWQHADKLELQARQDGPMFGLLLLDIDHFKWINDRYGHRTGDEVLRHVGGLLERNCGEGNHVCRYGGEEFVVIVVATDPDALRDLGERVRTGLARNPCPGPEGDIDYTVSIGLAYWLGGRDNVEGMFRRADRALYEAKETRNTCLMWNPAMDYDPEARNA